MGDAADDVYDAMWRRYMGGEGDEEGDIEPCAWRGGNDYMECPVCGLE